MRSYSKGIISFYCEITGMRQEKLRKVSTPCLLQNQMTDDELAHEGEMHTFAARILMRCLWLSRLARPDISFAVQRLASRNIATCELPKLNMWIRQACCSWTWPSTDVAGIHWQRLCILSIRIKEQLLVLYMSFKLVHHISHYYGPQRNKVRPRGVPQKLSSLHAQAHYPAKHTIFIQWLNL